MSLNSLAASRLVNEMRRSGRALEVAATAAMPVSEDTVDGAQADVQNALSALVEYIPTETITLYIATIGAQPVLAHTLGTLTKAAVYWSFVTLTPVLFALVYAGKRHAAGERRWPGWRQWPWWPTIAATIAFTTWAVAVPGGPYLTDDNGRVLAGLMAIVVSTLLGVVGRVFAAPSA